MSNQSARCDHPQPDSNPRLKLLLGDITAEDVDAIVNAANHTLLGGGGVDGAIHRAAGPELVECCRTLGGLRDRAGQDHAGVQSHGPLGHSHGGAGVARRFAWRAGTVLASCYRESLARADEVEAEVVAFPAISTGVFGYPMDAAATIAVETLRTTPTQVNEVRLVAFNQQTVDAYQSILALHTSAGP